MRLISAFLGMKFPLYAQLGLDTTMEIIFTRKTR